MATDAIIGALRVVLGADTAKFEEGLTRSQKQLRSFAKSVEEIASGIALEKTIEKVFEEIVHTLKEGFERIDAVGKTAQKVGLGVEEFTKLNLAAKLSDVSVESLSTALGKLSKNMVEASKGTGDAREVFENLGINVKDSEGKLKSVSTVLAELADKFAHTPDGVAKTTIALQLLGKGGKDLIPLLNEGKDSLEDLAKTAEAMGLVIGKDTFNQVQKFNDNIKILMLSKEGLTNLVIERLIPGLVRLSDQFVTLAKDGQAVRAAADKIADAIKAFVTFVYQAVVADELLGKAFNELFKAVDEFGNATNKLVTTTFTAVTTFFTNLYNQISGYINPIISVMGTIFNKVIEEIGKKFAFWKAVIDLVWEALKNISPELQKVEDAAGPGAFDEVVKHWENFKKILGTDLPKALQDAADKVSAAFQTMHAEGHKATTDLDTGTDKLQQTLNHLSISTRELQGDFVGLAAGFAQQAANLHLTDEAATELGLTMEQLTPKQLLLNQAMLENQAARLTQENLLPWEQHAQQLERIQLLYQTTGLTAEQAAIAMRKSAESTGQAWDIAASKMVGDLASGLKAFAAQNKSLAGAAKAAAIAQALINTYTAATKALATYPPPLSYAAAAAAVVAGLGYVSQIKAQEFATGGSFRIGGGMTGVDSEMVAFRATPGEMVDVRRPGSTGGGVQEVRLQLPTTAEFFNMHIREMVEALNRGAPDGYIIKVVT